VLIVPDERLTVRRTATGYWVVQRGSVELGGAPTRSGAEAERALREAVRKRSRRNGAGARRRRLRG
jgi:hypothetical protein